MDSERRALLRRVALVGAVGLAGCAGDGSDDTDGTETEAGGTTAGTGTEPETETATETETDTPTETPTEAEPETETASETESETDAPTETDTPTETRTQTRTESSSNPQSSVTVSVGANGRTRFDPESFVLEQGGTVTWKWASGGHNIVVASQPDGADWSGTPGGSSTTYDQGYSYEESFDVAGEYEYYCQPHRNFGMTGSFTVE